MDKDIIQKAVIAITKDKLWMDPSIEKIDGNTVLIKDTTSDSLDVVELIMEFEKEFRVSIPEDETENFEKQPIKKWAECISKLGGKPSQHALALIKEQSEESRTTPPSQKKAVVKPVKTKQATTPKKSSLIMRIAEKTQTITR